MQTGTRITRCEHCKFARRDVWAHQQCFLRWNGDNCHCCPPLHLETFVCQHSNCTNTTIETNWSRDGPRPSHQSLLKKVNRWIDEGGKATLVGAPEADILAAAIEILRKRIAAGTATFLVKVKAHRGEPANEGADILADKAISDPKVGKEWCQRTNRAVFT